MTDWQITSARPGKTGDIIVELTHELHGAAEAYLDDKPSYKPLFGSDDVAITYVKARGAIETKSCVDWLEAVLKEKS